MRETNLTLLQLQHMDLPEHHRKRLHKIFYRSELLIHKTNKSEVHICIKTHFDGEVIDYIFDDVFPGLLAKILNIVPEKFKVMTRNIEEEIYQRPTFSWLKVSFMVTKFYIDLVTDSIVVYFLLSLYGFEAIRSHFTLLSSQIILLDM